VSLRAPGLAATLHVAASATVDERPDGAWHAEWPTLRELLRLVVGGADRLGELTTGLTVDLDRTAANLSITGDDILAERVALSGIAGSASEYTGLSNSLVDAAIARARA
jgi:3-carboxy-cis,cis-muconate cycloisomerase